MLFRSGLRAAGRALGDEHMFDEDKWEYVNHYNAVCPMVFVNYTYLFFILYRLTVSFLQSDN